MADADMIVRFACIVRKDERASAFVSYCPALDIYSQGETEEEAIAGIQSAVALYLKAALRRAALNNSGGPGTSRVGTAVPPHSLKQVEVPVTLPGNDPAVCPPAVGR